MGELDDPVEIYNYTVRELHENNKRANSLKKKIRKLQSHLESDEIPPIMKENTRLQIRILRVQLSDLTRLKLEDYDTEVGPFIQQYNNLKRPVYNFFKNEYERTETSSLSSELTARIKFISEQYVTLPEIVCVSDRVMCDCGYDLTSRCSSSSDRIECPSCFISRYACSARLTTRREGKSEMKKFFDKFQGSDVDLITSDLIEKIKSFLTVDNPTHQDIFTALSRMHMNEYSKDVNSILFKINGTESPKVKYLTNKFMEYHTKIKTAYGRINKRRKSNLGVEYQGYMIFGMLRCPFPISNFKIIKNELQEYNDLFRRSCLETKDKEIINSYLEWENKRQEYEG